MKKLLMVTLALCTLNGFAQGERKQRKGHGERIQQMKDMSPEDIASIKSKKLALGLTLDEKQESEVYGLILEEVKFEKAKREERLANKTNDEKPSKEERLAMQNERLEKQIEFKRKMKSILTSEQFEKFEKLNSKKDRKKARHGKRKRK